MLCLAAKNLTQLDKSVVEKGADLKHLDVSINHLQKGV